MAWCNKIYEFVKKVFLVGLTILLSFTSVNSLSCISMNNQESKTRPQFVNVNGDKPANICVPDVVKNLNIKVFNLMSRIDESRHIEWHKTWKCECKFGANICNNKQRWNNHKCRCECKELIDKGVCDKGFLWNPSNCECECDKVCDVSEYLDYENCKCTKELVDKLVDECAETVEEVELAKITLAENENKYKCSSCTLYIVLFSILFIINIRIGAFLFIFTGT